MYFRKISQLSSRKSFTKQKENDFMGIWSTIKSWFGGSSSGGSRTTTNYNYEPDKVKIATN